jgi:hypothetical protein
MVLVERFSDHCKTKRNIDGTRYINILSFTNLLRNVFMRSLGFTFRINV